MKGNVYFLYFEILIFIVVFLYERGIGLKNKFHLF